jgi:outer membrane lipoprotein-sorting protein
MKTSVALIFFCLFLSINSSADSAVTKAAPPVSKKTLQAGSLQKILEKYAQASSLQADIKKTDEKIILGTRAESKGKLKYANKKIRITLEGEKKVEFLYANRTVTLVEYPDADFAPNSGRKVTVLKKSIPPFLDSLLNLFSNPKIFNKAFAVVSEKKDKETLTIELKPEQKTIKNLTLKIDLKTNVLTEVVFVDDVETKTTIEMTETAFNKKLDKNEFTFTKLKTDEEMKE